MSQRRVRFVRFHAPYEANEIAGFLAHRAKELVEVKQVAVYDDLPKIDFDAMDRDALVAYARDHLGLADAPPDSVSDDEIRAALRGASLETLAPPAGQGSGGDELDLLDRVHLEAYAADKAGLGAIDPTTSDADLRAAIRAQLAIAVNAPVGKGKSKRS